MADYNSAKNATLKRISLTRIRLQYRVKIRPLKKPRWFPKLTDGISFLLLVRPRSCIETLAVHFTGCGIFEECLCHIKFPPLPVFPSNNIYFSTQKVHFQCKESSSTHPEPSDGFQSRNLIADFIS